MNKIPVALFCVTIGLGLGPIQAAAGDIEQGKTKSAACAGCHGPDGNSMVPSFPKLAGQGERYIVEQLAAFKANEARKNEIMLGMAAGLSDEDAADIGAYYQAQKVASTAPHDESKLPAGKQIYKGGDVTRGIPACQGCHGPDGAGNAPAGYPQLGGQYTDYTISQLMAFKNGDRTTDDKMLMRSIVDKMTEEEITAVAHYIASIK